MEKINQIIKNTNDESVNNIDWTKEWSQKYPILSQYQDTVDIEKYANKIRMMLNDLKDEYGYDKLDAMLVLKDILYHEWKNKD